jgi:ABC-type multidrug transport system ATPase subunit
MNRTLGTTIIVSSPNEDLVKNFASVFIFMDNGHISKIRSKSNRIAKSRRKSRKGNFSNNRKTSKKGSNHKVQKQHKKNDKINKQNNSNDLQSHSRGKTQNKKQQSLIENKRYNHSKNKNRKNNENYSTKPADRQIEKKHFEKKNNYEDSPDKSGNIE